MKPILLYLHGAGGTAQEADRFRAVCLACEVRGVDYPDARPEAALPPIRAAFAAARQEGREIMLLANSIGAYYAMLALPSETVSRALFVSPVVDLERLLCDLLRSAGADEDALRAQGKIVTPAGPTVFWDDLCYVRAHPVEWTAPTAILCAADDRMVARETVEAFAARHGAALTVLPEGEHWFHTPAQLAALDAWLRTQLG